jgi:hypothetical protein
MLYDNDKGPCDHAHAINVDEAWERGYWTARFQITEAELRSAIGAVGEMVVDVKRHLGK